MKKDNHETDERNEKETGSKVSSFVLFVPFVVKKYLFLFLLLLCASAPLRKIPLAQAQEKSATLPLDQFQPRSMLVLPEHRPARAKFPAVDVHLHARKKLRQSPEALAEYVRLMDNQNIAISVSLDGELGEQLEEHKKFLWTKYPDRFVIFANINWQGDGKANEPATWDCQRTDFARRMAAALADAKQRGASGLKIFKDFGLVYRKPDGTLIAIDDPRWDPIWTACGELGLPILIHAGDPAAFFQPLDRFNERYEELSRHPDWHFPADRYPRHADVLASFLRVVARHPKTTFIGAHFANNPENLAELGGWLDKYPNLNVELAARIAELGRQPRAAREFCLKYADRILFGTDGPRDVKRLAPHWRLLETADEYFPYAEDQYPPQGFWSIYGLDLPDGVLRKIYNENAARLIPGVRERLQRQNIALP
ncbi:Amidohydrolase [Lacipirellula limnantheis]|uniref:Amidohydrolase n=1 Tax=Lacipirellula limnantheis TaxID=2528024 RepID=A0A517TSR4_9BACT|nr:Amidohydrolase [Lacipirellula limnantheis]